MVWVTEAEGEGCGSCNCANELPLASTNAAIKRLLNFIIVGLVGFGFKFMKQGHIIGSLFQKAYL